MADGGDIKRGRKFDQVLAGAKEVFMAQGFEGASVDDIARVAGVSKATLYSYFPDKKLLFLEVASEECRVQATLFDTDVDDSMGPREVLRTEAQRMMDLLYSEFGINVFRICVAESDRFPEIGRQFMESGPMVWRARMIQYLKEAVQRGQLAIEDFDLAADQFAEMCKAMLHQIAVFGGSAAVTEPEKERVREGAIETFMARYGV